MRLVESDGEDYRGQHQAPDKAGGAPLYDITLNGIYPEDVYSGNGYRYYVNPEESGASESFSIAMSLHERPNALVKMFRAVPKNIEGVDIKKINTGDWVAVSRRYVTDHGRNSLRNQYRIITKTVYARDLFTDGNSICEWGYDPQPRDTSGDAERRRRMSLIAQLPEDTKKLYYAKRKQIGIYVKMTPEQWDELYQSFAQPQQEPDDR